MLMASLFFCAGCPTATPEPRAPIVVRPPCNLPPAPEQPVLSGTQATDNAVVLTLPDARKLISYLQRVHAWMQQAAECSRPFADGASSNPYGGR